MKGLDRVITMNNPVGKFYKSEGVGPAFNVSLSQNAKYCNTLSSFSSINFSLKLVTFRHRLLTFRVSSKLMSILISQA